jgi:hypothetical protein
VRLRLALAGLALLASGCVFYPKTVESYDPVCEIRTRQMVLKSEVVDGLCSASSHQDAAAACLVAVLSVTAGSAVISGSIVAVGNTVYWLEKRGKCIARS